jgi:hypothetical protein
VLGALEQAIEPGMITEVTEEILTGFLGGYGRNSTGSKTAAMIRLYYGKGAKLSKNRLLGMESKWYPSEEGKTHGASHGSSAAKNSKKRLLFVFIAAFYVCSPNF